MGDSLSDAIAGIRVVALEQAVSMPFCTQILAALGADVVKIEAPGRGDVIRGWDAAVEGLSTGFVAFNVGKRDVTVDAKAPEGREILRRLAASADVFVENFSPGVAARLGLGPDELCGADSRLIYCSLSGYGQTGPYRDVKAYDLLVQGESGILLSNGTEDAPAKVGIPITDQIAGAHATIGILAALNRRAATGDGAYLDLAMLESAAYWLAYYPHHWWHGATEPPRTGMRHQYLSPYGPFRTADGKYVSVVVASEVDWQRFCDALQRADWASDPAFATVADRSQRRRQLDAMVEEVIGEAPLEHWAERLAQAGLAHGTVRTIAEVVDHPQLIDRGVFVEGDSPVGPLRQIRFPLSEPTRLDVPGLGEHTDEVLAELGYSAADISELRASRVI